MRGRGIETQATIPSGDSNPYTAHDYSHENASRLCDSRLANLKIQYWTVVPISDSLAADLISTFLLIEGPIYGFFDPELFIGDIVSQEGRFCSPLLVNAVLFWASVSDIRSRLVPTSEC